MHKLYFSNLYDIFFKLILYSQVSLIQDTPIITGTKLGLQQKTSIQNLIHNCYKQRVMKGHHIDAF